MCFGRKRGSTVPDSTESGTVPGQCSKVSWTRLKVNGSEPV